MSLDVVMSNTKDPTMRLVGKKADLDELARQLRELDQRCVPSDPKPVPRDAAESGMGFLELYAVAVFLGEALLGGVIYDAAKDIVLRLIKAGKIKEQDKD
jgi:hypothetical protein